jgi:hypothetical protein
MILSPNNKMKNRNKNKSFNKCNSHMFRGKTEQPKFCTRETARMANDG